MLKIKMLEVAALLPREFTTRSHHIDAAVLPVRFFSRDPIEEQILNAPLKEDKMEFTMEKYEELAGIVKETPLTNKTDSRNLALGISKFMDENFAGFDCDLFLDACGVN